MGLRCHYVGRLCLDIWLGIVVVVEKQRTMVVDMGVMKIFRSM